MKVYIMRHGTTVWNEKKRTQGRSQNRLSASGKELVEETAKKYMSAKFDVIFSSPLMRTMQTSNIMNKYHNVKVIKDEHLIEIDKGVLTGRFSSSLTEEEKHLRKVCPESLKIETYKSVFERANEFVNDVLKTCKFQNVLIVTHGVVARFLYAILANENIDINNPEVVKKFENAEIKEIDIET